jgi:glyoxylate/hydroxypyruvate reductase A
VRSDIGIARRPDAGASPDGCGPVRQLTTKGAILVTCDPWPAEPWVAAARAADPERPVFVWPNLPDPVAIRYAMAWRPPEGMLASLPNLVAIFSLGAGVDHIVLQKGLPDVPIVRIVSDDLTQRMTEWVALQVLTHHRRAPAYARQQAARTWKELPQPRAAQVRVGIMGMGVLGRDAAEVLVRLGFRVAGWSRRPTTVAGVEAFAGADGLDPFLARTDILVCLLPLTKETRGILAMPLFAKLARDGVLGGPVVINAGRGGLQVEADIVRALAEGVLAGASLDVFEEEPLPASSPLWTMPNVVITPHAAAASAPKELVPLMIEQMAGYEAGLPLTNVIDRVAMY